MIQTSTRYTKTAVILHWLTVVFMVFLFILGWFMTDLPKEAPKQSAYDILDLGVYTWQLAEAATPRTFYFNLHKSLGLTILALIAMRVLWRITHKPPELLSSYKSFERKLATAMHHILYLLMVVLPLSGFVMALYSKYGIKWFGINLISGIDNKGLRDFFKESHETIGIIILVFIALHVAAALKHKFIDKDETLKRMTLK